jgi:hypothetical protein
MSSASKRQKQEEEVEEEDDPETSLQRLTAAIEASAFPHIDALQHLLMRYIVYKAFEPPPDRSADTLEDAQFMWEKFVEWCKEMGRQYVGTYQGLPVEGVDHLPRRGQTAAVLWVSQVGGGFLTGHRIEGSRLTHVALVASCGTSALATQFTDWAELEFLSKLSTLQEVVLVLPGLKEIGDGWLSKNPRLRHVHFEGMAGLTRVGSNWLSGCPLLKSVDFGGLGKLAGVRSGWLVGCHRLLTADFSGLEGLDVVEWRGDDSDMFHRVLGSGPVGWLSAADRPQPPSLRLKDGSLQTHRVLLMWEKKCPTIIEICLRHYGTFKKLSQGDWGVSDVDPLAYNWRD